MRATHHSRSGHCSSDALEGDHSPSGAMVFRIVSTGHGLHILLIAVALETSKEPMQCPYRSSKQ